MTFHDRCFRVSTDRGSWRRQAISLGLAGLMIFPLLTGCEKKKPPPPPPPPPPKAPPPPEPAQVDALMQTLHPDARVQFPQSQAPVDESLARATIGLANAIAKGDASGLSPMLADSARNVLDKLTSSGQWDDAAKRIEGVRVVGVTQTPSGQKEATSATVTLAIQEPGRAFVTGWSATRAGDTWKFDSAPSPEGTRTRASEWDGTTTTAAAPMSSGGSSDMASAASAAGVSSDEVTVLAYAALELANRVETASGTKLPEAQKTQALGMMAQIPGGGSFDQIKTAAKAKLDAGYKLQIKRIPVLVMAGDAMAAQLGGKVTHDQVIQFVSNILNIPEGQVRSALTGAPEGPTPITPRGRAPMGG